MGGDTVGDALRGTGQIHHGDEGGSEGAEGYFSFFVCGGFYAERGGELLVQAVLLLDLGFGYWERGLVWPLRALRLCVRPLACLLHLPGVGMA